jgi:uncharacterized protein (DUF433 family)
MFLQMASEKIKEADLAGGRLIFDDQRITEREVVRALGQ